ncbi:hypothetical protein ACQEPB_00390 [Novosphingobium fluoreni]|uniref:hypothetical protein n=1 Tax=Novosphingobium fluoreni TaxID=1391222 RepID=UPI003DA12819
MIFLSIDQSKRSTGYALWDQRRRPVIGHFQLGSEYTSDGATFCKLHERLYELRSIAKFDAIYYEQPINPAQLQGHTTIDTILLAGGLAAHIQSFGTAMGCRIVKSVNVQHWRPDFIGKIQHNDETAKVRRARKAGDKRASARDTLKQLTMERCRQLGFTPRNDDEADAIAILTYAVLLNGITPPWLAEETLRPIMEGAAA